MNPVSYLKIMITKFYITGMSTDTTSFTLRAQILIKEIVCCKIIVMSKGLINLPN